MHPRDYSNIRRKNYSQKNPDSKSLEGLDVLLHIDSFCLGDTICWASLLEAFVKHHRPSRLRVTTFWPEILRNMQGIEFIDAVGDGFIECDKFVSAGYEKGNLYHALHGMFPAARKSMNLPDDAPFSKSVFREHEYEKIPNKIVIAPESTKKIARWDYMGNQGWQEVIDRLNEMGMEVHNVSYEKTLMLRSLHSHNGNPDVNNAIRHICEAQIFIGLGSGLSWLAWAYDIPVVMICGFTKPFMEFPCYRAWNEHCCTGCYNIFTNVNSHCPIFLGTQRESECHRTITPDMVMKQVEKALENELFYNR